MQVIGVLVIGAAWTGGAPKVVAPGVVGAKVVAPRVVGALVGISYIDLVNNITNEYFLRPTTCFTNV